MTEQLVNEWVVLSYIAHQPDDFAWEAAGLDPLLFSPGETRVVANAIRTLVAQDKGITWRRIRLEAKRAGNPLSQDAIWNLAHGVGVCSGMEHYLGELVAARHRRRVA